MEDEKKLDKRPLFNVSMSMKGQCTFVKTHEDDDDEDRLSALPV